MAEPIQLMWRWQEKFGTHERVFTCCNAWRLRGHTQAHLVRMHTLTQREAKQICDAAVAYVSTAAQRTRARQERMDGLQTRSLVKQLLAEMDAEGSA